MRVLLIRKYKIYKEKGRGTQLIGMNVELHSNVS
jgi:hypothetical protein